MIVFIISNRVSDLPKISINDSPVNFILIISKLNFEKITISRKSYKTKNTFPKKSTTLFKNIISPPYNVVFSNTFETSINT